VEIVRRYAFNSITFPIFVLWEIVCFVQFEELVRFASIFQMNKLFNMGNTTFLHNLEIVHYYRQIVPLEMARLTSFMSFRLILTKKIVYTTG